MLKSQLLYSMVISLTPNIHFLQQHSQNSKRLWQHKRKKKNKPSLPIRISLNSEASFQKPRKTNLPTSLVKMWFLTLSKDRQKFCIIQKRKKRKMPISLLILTSHSVGVQEVHISQSLRVRKLSSLVDHNSNQFSQSTSQKLRLLYSHLARSMFSSINQRMTSHMLYGILSQMRRLENLNRHKERMLHPSSGVLMDHLSLKSSKNQFQLKKQTKLNQQKEKRNKLKSLRLILVSTNFHQ